MLGTRGCKPACYAVCIFASLLFLVLAGIICVKGTTFVSTADVKSTARGFLQRSRRLQLGTGIGLVAPTTTLPSIFDSSDSSSSIGSSLEPSKSSESGSFRDSSTSGNDQLLRNQLTATLYAWFGYGGTLVIMLLFACLYKSNAVQPVLRAKGTLQSHLTFDRRNPSIDFSNNILECYKDKWTCIHGCCCPLVRMAHTNAVAGILGYWTTAVSFCLCSMCFCHTCLMVYWRMQLKEIMNIEDHCINDFVVTFCCPQLAICQQAAAVDHELGYEVEYCCSLDWYSDELNARHEAGHFG